MGMFDTVSDETIRSGGCTDIYFERTEETLQAEGINPDVVMEVTASALPDAWSVFCGLSDVLALLEGLPGNCRCNGRRYYFFKKRSRVTHIWEIPGLLPV